MMYENDDIFLNKRIINLSVFFFRILWFSKSKLFVIDNPFTSEPITISVKEIQTKYLNLLIPNSNFEKYVFNSSFNTLSINWKI